MLKNIWLRTPPVRKKVPVHFMWLLWRKGGHTVGLYLLVSGLGTLLTESPTLNNCQMSGGFGGCTINLVKKELYQPFIDAAVEQFTAKYGHAPKIYDVVISDGARKLD